MQTRRQIVQEFSRKTGITDSEVDTFVEMQDKYPGYNHRAAEDHAKYFDSAWEQVRPENVTNDKLKLEYHAHQRQKNSMKI